MRSKANQGPADLDYSGVNLPRKPSVFCRHSTTLWHRCEFREWRYLYGRMDVMKVDETPQLELSY